MLGTPQVTEETRAEICRVLAWDLKQLDVGTYDYVNHTGAFHPLESAREKLAGESMPLKAATRSAFAFGLSERDQQKIFTYMGYENAFVIFCSIFA